MLTIKRMIIPIFNFKLQVGIFDKWSDLKDVLEPDEYAEEAKGITIHRHGIADVYIGVKYESTIIHEAEHIKDAIWKFIGYIPQRDNDEVDAYLITYIYEKMMQVFRKHIINSRG